MKSFKEVDKDYKETGRVVNFGEGGDVDQKEFILIGMVDDHPCCLGFTWEHPDDSPFWEDWWSGTDGNGEVTVVNRKHFPGPVRC